MTRRTVTRTTTTTSRRVRGIAVDGAAIRRQRMLVRGLNGVALAAEAEMHSSYLSMIECGKVTRVGPEVFARLRKALGVDAAELLAPEKDETPKGIAVDGATIRRHRDTRGLSGVALAAKVGIHKSCLSRIEHGASNPSPEIFAKLSEALGVPAVELLAKDAK